jgi:hypothetical protein
VVVKRKKTDIVDLKLRCREALRARIERAAKTHEQSLNAEMVQRLETSFLQAENAQLIEALLGSGYNLAMLRGISTILTIAGNPAEGPPRNVADAIHKFVEVLAGTVPASESSFPERHVKGSADQLAWATILTGHFSLAVRMELTGGGS